MERFLVNLSLFFVIIYFYKVTKKGLHILQLENYYLDRYLSWMKKHKALIFRKMSFVIFLPTLLLILSFIFKNKILVFSFFAFEILSLIFMILKFKNTPEKKPFVVTARVRRMYFTYLVIFLILITLANIVNYKLILLIVNIFVFFSYFFVFIVGVINKPIEKIIRRGFINKAKKKLKDMTNLKVIGVTGSYGKTSTKFIVNSILSQKYNTLVTPESYNTTMGVVRTINENLKPIHELFICEMGAKYVGDIKEITDIVNPTYGVLTAIGPQHLDTFKTLDNVKKTKLELVDSLPENGIAFVNWEDPNIRDSDISKKTIKYGLSNEADYYATNINSNERGSSFDVVLPSGKKIFIKTKLLGKLNILNIVAGVAVGDTFGLNEDEIKLGIKYIRPVPHRLELKQNPNGSIVIDDAYNSNINGANMALDVLKSFTHKKRVLITPGIVELGDKQNEINEMFGEKASESADFIILVGANQTIPIYKGIEKKKFPKNKVFIAKNLNEALAKMGEIITKDTVILFENDLPDNYL